MKIKFIFYIVVLFSVAAFGWWGYSLVSFCEKEYKDKLQLINKEIGQASGTIFHRSDCKLYTHTFLFSGKEVCVDTVEINRVFIQQFPRLYLYAEGNKLAVVAKEEILEKINSEKLRKKYMYVVEGIAFLALLLWGFIWTYSKLIAIIRLNEQKSNFMTAVTHELKTPLASVKLFLQTLQRRKLEEHQLQQLIQSSIEDIERLNDLTENILLASHIEGGSYHYNMQEQSLSDTVESIAEMYALRHGSKYKFETEIDKGVVTFFDRMAITICLNNLLDNAMKYAPEHSRISISLRKRYDRAELSIGDEGKGIPREERHKVFDKFYRLGNENQRQAKGTGLGLFIVKRIFGQHDVPVEILDNKPTGIIFRMTFNIADHE